MSVSRVGGATILLMWTLVLLGGIYAQHPCGANRANLVNESVLGDGLRQQVLTCSTGGAAVSSVEWHRNGMQLDKGDNSKYKGANLFIDFTILNIVLEDEGVYSCTYNDGDPGSTQYCLEIEGYPQLNDCTQTNSCEMNVILGADVSIKVNFTDMFFGFSKMVTDVADIRLHKQLILWAICFTTCTGNLQDSGVTAQYVERPNALFVVPRVTEDVTLGVTASVSPDITSSYAVTLFVVTPSILSDVISSISLPMSATAVAISSTPNSDAIPLPMPTNSLPVNQSSLTMVATTSQTISSSSLPTTTDSNNMSAIIGGSVTAIIVAFLVIAVVLGVILFFYAKIKSQKYQLHITNGHVTNNTLTQPEQSTLGGEEYRGHSLPLDERLNSTPRSV